MILVCLSPIWRLCAPSAGCNKNRDTAVRHAPTHPIQSGWTDHHLTVCFYSTETSEMRVQFEMGRAQPESPLSENLCRWICCGKKPSSGRIANFDPPHQGCWMVYRNSVLDRLVAPRWFFVTTLDSVLQTGNQLSIIIHRSSVETTLDDLFAQRCKIGLVEIEQTLVEEII
jgi:hypothetical protein